jgi:hypothetical protein
MTFIYILKTVTAKWIKIMAESNLAQALVIQESPTIALSLLPLDKNTYQTVCCTKN